jgi:Zn-dependent metalloprotease
MRIATQLIRTLPTALLLAAITTSPASAQTRRGKKQAVLPDYDLRESNIAPATPQNPQSKALVDRRKSTMDAFVAARQVAQPGIRIVPSRFGIPKLMLREGNALSAASTRDPDEIARNFLRANVAVFPFATTEIDQLRLVVRDVTPEATHLVYNQTLNGIDVYQGQIKFTLGKSDEVIQVASGEAVPGLNVATTPRLQPDDAERAARSAARAESKGRLLRAPELVIFPVDASTARLAYRFFLEVDATQLYEILVDAEDGTLLFRHNAYVRAAQARVWIQSPSQGSRQLVTFPDGWLSATSAVTSGNNVDAFVDTDGTDTPDRVNTGGLQNGRPVSTSQVFDFPFGDGTLGLNPANFQAAAVTNLFYFANIAHDFYYSLGFTEAAGNFQTNNFNLGGIGGDAVIAEAQNGDSEDNSSFAPTPDGISPRIRIGVFTRSTSTPDDDLDADYDGQVVLHEYGHGVSNRLVGGGTSTSCLEQIQSGAMGEGWSDYFAISYFNNPVLGAYVSQNMTRGLRRQSYEGYTFTYEDVGNSGYEVHNDGEIWAATLWDLRKSLGQTVTDRLVVNGLKATPCNPSMTDARDAILSADLASNGGANRVAIWTIFAKHGLGFSARGVDGFAGTLYDAAYDLPPDLQNGKNPLITSEPLFVPLGVGDLYAYRVLVSNPNAGTLDFELNSGPNGMTVNPLSGAVNWIATFTGQRVKITVTDGKGGKSFTAILLPYLLTLLPARPFSSVGQRIPSALPILKSPLVCLFSR